MFSSSLFLPLTMDLYNDPQDLIRYSGSLLTSDASKIQYQMTSQTNQIVNVNRNLDNTTRCTYRTFCASQFITIGSSENLSCIRTHLFKLQQEVVNKPYFRICNIVSLE